MTDTKPEPRPPTFLQIVWSVLASFFGVQSRKNRERDFTSGKAPHYLAIAVIMTALFVLTLWLVVQLVMHFARP